MHEHYQLDMKPAKNSAAYDPEYDTEHKEQVGDHEHYHDPDFDEEWNKVDEESQNESHNRINIAQKPPEQVNEDEILPSTDDVASDMINDWEEV